jgi:hypothetical protein
MGRAYNYIIFSVAVILAPYCRNDKASKEIRFDVAHTASISRIELNSNDLGVQSLYREKERWWLSDSILVRPDAIENILKILPSIKVKYYPPKASWEYMINAIRQEGVHLSLFDDHHQLIQSMYLGGTTNDETGTYAMIDGSSQPYVVYVPGFNGNLATRFKMSNEDWRDRMIIAVNAEDIEVLSIDYKDNPEQGFKIERIESGQFEVRDIHRIQIKYSVSLLRSYLDGYLHVGCEGIENDFRNKSLVLSSQPFATVQLKLREKPVRTIKFYTMEAVGEEGRERLFVYDERDFYLAQLRILQKLFRSIDYFRAQ